jgi:hypothetical protein
MVRLLKASTSVLALATLIACSDDPAPTSPPKAIRPVTPTELSGTVGTKVEGGVTVHVVDYNDRSVEGAKVGFSITAGDGSLSSRLVITDVEGIAHIDWTLGEAAGANEIVASIFGVDSTAEFSATGNPAAPVGLSITPRVVRIPSNVAGGTVTARVVDQFGNPTTGTASFTSRNTALVTVSNSGQITATETTASNRGGSTYVVITAGGYTDSAKVYTLSPADPACTGISASASLAVGEVMLTGFSDNGICVAAAAGDREYALVPFYNNPVPSAATIVTVSGLGVKATASNTLGAVRPRDQLALSSDVAVGVDRRAALDRRLRLAERREMPARAVNARRWYASRSVEGRRATLATTVPAVGDQVELNVNAIDFCASPSMRTGRVVAVTTRAVVIADLANPAGFTDADYASLGATFDTLVYATDAANFGAPTDIDDNGNRVVLFFTHAVNELGPGTLGFAYSRDLLPKSGPLGSCPGSNVGEIINIYVPDPNTTIAEVKANAVATMGHELQHVINSGRRLYVNTTGSPIEERWLNEGLSHVAEELLFYRSSGLAPRQNLGSQLTAAANLSAYVNFQRQNFNRYFRFTRVPEIQGPIGVDDDDDDLETRGAIWSFLRYAADQRAAGNEAAFWQALENSNSTGLQNLYDHIGADARLVIRDWTLSNFLDDLVTTEAKYTQPSWNLRQVPGFQNPSTFSLVTSASATTPPSSTVTLGALSSLFVRFGVGANQEAYVNVTGFPANTQLPRGVVLALVRTK